MKFLTVVATFLAILPATLAVDQSKSAIIYFDEKTPDSFIQQVMDSITNAGGIITHYYEIIHGFACQAPAKALETVRAMSSEYSVKVEEDEMVSAL